MPYQVTHNREMAVMDQATRRDGFSLEEAFAHASNLLSQGKSNVAIVDSEGHIVEGADLIACCNGRKRLTTELRVVSG